MSTGSGKAYLVYRPYFYNANGRFQVVLSADITNERAAHGGHRDGSGVFFVTTVKDTNMSDICKDGASFEGVITAR